MALKSKEKGAAKLMPLHKRIATGNKPVQKPSGNQLLAKAMKSKKA